MGEGARNKGELRRARLPLRRLVRHSMHLTIARHSKRGRMSGPRPSSGPRNRGGFGQKDLHL